MFNAPNIEEQLAILYVYIERIRKNESGVVNVSGGSMSSEGVSKIRDHICEAESKVGSTIWVQMLLSPSEQGQLFDLSTKNEVLGFLFGLLRVSFWLVAGRAPEI